MATSTIKLPELTQSFSNPTVSGASAITVQSSNVTKYGQLVFVSARIKATANISSANDAALFLLNPQPSADSNTVYVTGLITINRSGGSMSTYADCLALRKWPNNNYYLTQVATNNLSANDMIEVLFCYFC